MVNPAISLLLARFIAPDGKINTTFDSPTIGEPPIQLEPFIHDIDMDPLHVCMAGARRSSNHSNCGRREPTACPRYLVSFRWTKRFHQVRRMMQTPSDENRVTQGEQGTSVPRLLG